MPTDAPIPKPSADDFLQIIRRQQLGKLKIYIGASPGVGKTFQMLIWHYASGSRKDGRTEIDQAF